MQTRKERDTQKALYYSGKDSKKMAERVKAIERIARLRIKQKKSYARGLPKHLLLRKRTAKYLKPGSLPDLIEQFETAIKNNNPNDLLAMRGKLGDVQALNKLIRINKPLFITITRSYIQQYPSDREAILQAARIAFWNACKNYDPRKSSYNTYGGNAIRLKLKSKERGTIRSQRARREILGTDYEKEEIEGTKGTRFLETVAAKDKGGLPPISVIQSAIEETIPTLSIEGRKITARDMELLRARLLFEGDNPPTFRKLVKEGKFRDARGRKITRARLQQIEARWMPVLRKRLEKKGIRP